MWDAGGRVETDLFGDRDHTYLLDGEILDRLCIEKLQVDAEAAGLMEKWAWVDAVLDFDENAGLVQAKKVESQPTEEETAKIEDLQDKREACWQESDYTQGRAYNAEIDKIEESIRSRDYWSDEVLSTAGCVVTVGFNGQLRLYEGLWRQNEIPEEVLEEQRQREEQFNKLVDEGRNGRKKAKPKKGPLGIAQKPLAELRSLRTDVIRANMTPAAARKAIEYDLVCEVFGSSLNKILDIRFAYDSRTKNAETDYDPLNDRINALETDWTKAKDPYGAWLALPEETRDELLAAAVGTLLNRQLATDDDRRPGYELLVGELEIDWPGVRPSKDLFWSKLSKPELSKLARKLFGSKWMSIRSDLKKGELVDAIADAMETSNRKAVREFVMPGFAAKA